jgi:hypothetical protein
MYIKSLIRDILPAPIYRIVYFYRYHQRIPNLIYPKTFNDKLCRRMLFDRDPQMTLFADKCSVRDFVRERLGGDTYLTRLHTVYDNAANIHSTTLPARFVLKPNHASGLVYLHNGATDPDRNQLEALSKKWLESNYYKRSKEWCYKNIKRRILIEEYLGDGLQPPSDFKFFCFGGVVKLIQLDLDRYVGHKRNMYDREWNLLDFEYRYPSDKDKFLEKPKQLNLMIEIAEKLSAGTKFVRVDLYCIGNDVRFGEITNYPEGGEGRFKPQSWDLSLGEMWSL